ncbi:MAG: beta-phosphoglucomutase family hydrolase [Bacteroidetes bacterium]|nr:beta-phosphoglucomutase family hydrolase [Bacteroidota bacterium]
MTDYGFDAVIFDLDGVITRTALVHSAAWKKMFDDYLKDRVRRYGEIFREFDHEQDYLPFVDGKPRYKGVQDFLESRGIHLPFGNPEDITDMETICGLGNRKNEAFNDVLRTKGVEVYDSTVDLIYELQRKGIKVGVASSSKNCRAVLERADLLKFMNTRVDGEVSAELGLKGKPEPDIFTVACDNLGVPYDRAVVVEDAVSGVQAGRKGNFGLVLGIARENNEHELQRNGADIVVSDIGKIGFDGIAEWFATGLDKDNWSIAYYDYDPKLERNRESLLTIGNGYFGTRGAMDETTANSVNYPGTYMSSVYNRLVSKVAGRDVENEDFVNVIDWHFITFRIDDEEWLDINKVKIEDIKRTLLLNDGILYRRVVIKDEKGRRTLIESRRIASMDIPHLAAVEYSVIPVNYSATITMKSGLYGDHINAGVDRYKELNQRHLEPVEEGCSDNAHFVVVQTTQSKIKIAVVARMTAVHNGQVLKPVFMHNSSKGRSELLFSREMKMGEEIKVHKIAALHKSTDHHQINPCKAALSLLKGYSFFKDVHTRSAEQWETIWDTIDIKVEGDRLTQKLLRLHLYHSLVTTSPHNSWIDTGIPARGLHGEAYRGHIFWDELYILPIYFIHFKDAARSVLMYRYRRLDAARKYAMENGYSGAMFPWQSGSDGREETQIIHLNPVSGKWDPDHSSLQRHVSLAIAYNIWYYFWITGDLDFIKSYGAELFFEICRFWASKSKLNSATGKYEIDRVMGPDEFHEKYENSDTGGLKDNAYTNLMVAWTFRKAQELYSALDNESKLAVERQIHLTVKELAHWQELAGSLNIVISEDGVIAQYDGYFKLKELDWDFYKKKYGNIYRFDRILKAEGQSPDEYKVAKQADTLMTFYNLDKDEVDEILNAMGYKLPVDYLERNLNYYLKRTSHGSTLSRVVHAHLANLLGDKKLSWSLYSDALTSDYNDIQGGTTGEGIHAGVMTGTVWLAISSYAGLNLRSEMVKFNPNLPDHWRSVEFKFTFKEKNYHCIVSKLGVNVKVDGPVGHQIKIGLADKSFTVKSGEWHKIIIS